MKFTEQKLKGVFVIEPQVFGDSRGYFMESYKKELFEKYIGVVDFIQDNESRSSYGVGANHRRKAKELRPNVLEDIQKY